MYLFVRLPLTIAVLCAGLYLLALLHLLDIVAEVLLLLAAPNLHRGLVSSLCPGLSHVKRQITPIVAHQTAFQSVLLAWGPEEVSGQQVMDPLQVLEATVCGLSSRRVS